MNSSIDNIRFVLERMKSFTLRIFVDDRIQNYLSLKVHDGGKLWNMYNSITNYLLDEPYIHSLYLINRETGSPAGRNSGGLLLQ